MKESTQKEFTFNAEQTRLDSFLSEENPDISRSYIKKLIQEEKVLVNHEPVKKAGVTLKSGDHITLIIPPVKPTKIIPEKIKLDIIYEDRNVLIINKPAGMVVHPSAGHDAGTLVHAIVGYLPRLARINDTERPGVVHRLDKDTSGIIIFAKKEKALHHLQAQFAERMVEKHYIALVDGRPKTPQGRIETFIGRDIKQRKKMAVVPEKKGKLAVTEYATLQEFENHTLLDVRIYTGRTHQIRVHMAFLGCPIAGDTIYGHTKSSVKLKRHFLHASRLSIILPGQYEPQEFKAPLPEELENCIQELGAH